MTTGWRKDRPARSQRRCIALTAVISSLATVTVVIVAAVVLSTARPAAGASAAVPFSPSSPWRSPIPGNAPSDPQSAEMIASVVPQRALYANLVEFGIPVFTAAADTPRYSVPCRVTDWGVCPFAGWSIPIPGDARPHSGSDGAMVVVDEAAQTIFEFWQARRGGEQWSASFGAVNALSGSGWGGAATGSGASRLGGVIRVAEIANGDIPHALALQTNNACAGVFRPPALKTDGNSQRPNCIPEGARLQLDPSLDVESLGLAPGPLAVARAMQRYGGYIVDIGGAPLSVSFELDVGAPPGQLGDVYRAAGFHGDYDAMAAVPWERLRVLE